MECPFWGSGGQVAFILSGLFQREYPACVSPTIWLGKGARQGISWWKVKVTKK